MICLIFGDLDFIFKVIVLSMEYLLNQWRGWSDGAMVLGKLPVPGRPTVLAYSRAKAYCTCSRCGWGLFGRFFSLVYHFSFLSPALWETV